MEDFSLSLLSLCIGIVTTQRSGAASHWDGSLPSFVMQTSRMSIGRRLLSLFLDKGFGFISGLFHFGCATDSAVIGRMPNSRAHIPHKRFQFLFWYIPHGSLLLFFLSSRFLRRRRVASIVAALPEGACGSMGAMPRTIPRIFWPAPESRPSDKCSGRRCSLAELWFPFDFFFLKKYLFIYPSREERQQLQVAYHRPRSTFFFPLSYPPISGSDCGSVTSPLYYFLFSFLLVVVVVFVHINQLHRHITMDANRGRVE